MARIMEDTTLIPKSVEVYNVSGAGGTIGLAQLASKAQGESNQMMVMGLVMLGAIETNQAPLDVSDTTPLAALTSEPEAIVVRAESDVRDLEDLVDRMREDPSSVSLRRRLGRRHGPDPARAARPGGRRRPERDQVHRLLGRRRGQPGDPLRLGDGGHSGASEFEDQVSGGKMRVLAVSTEKPVRVGGKEAPTIRDAGFDVVVENWRGVVAPPDILPAERTAMVAALDRLHASPEWEKALERNGWTDFYKPGDEFTRFLAAENRRVDRIIAELGLGE